MKNFMSLTNSLKARLKRKGGSEREESRDDGAHSVNSQPPSSLCINPPMSVSPSGNGQVSKKRRSVARRLVPGGRWSDGSSGGCGCSCSDANSCSTSGCSSGAGRRQARGRKSDKKINNLNNSNGKGRNSKISRSPKASPRSGGRLGSPGRRSRSRRDAAMPAWVETLPPTSGSATLTTDSGDSVRVLVRIRPPLVCEAKYGADVDGACCVQAASDDSLCVVSPPGRTQFSYDRVLGPGVSQAHVFQLAGQAVVENCLQGYNSCIFAYGQTGSGKTYTMLGDLLQDGEVSNAAGLIPRVFQYLFSRISQLEAADRSVSYFCKCSLLEIYNERITDLLTRASALQIREDAKRGVYVKGLTEEDIFTVDDALSLLRRGSINRRVGGTGMNSKSSRSHCVLTCVIESKSTDRNGLTKVLRSRLNLVDLAGSERQKTSGAAGRRLKEASNINRSLSTLGLVIMSLVESQQGRKPKHVPYRDSKLTFLLQDSLGGNSKTVMIANVSPVACNLSETLSTLRFASGAKLVKNRVIANEDITGDARLLKLEISKLKEELARYKAMMDNHNAKAIVPAALPLQPARTVAHPLVVDALRREDAAVKKAALIEAQFVQAQLVIKLKELDGRRQEKIVKLRDEKIQRLEASLEDARCEAGVNPDAEVAELRAEVDLLKEKLADNPEVAALSAENRQLKSELAALKATATERERAEDEINRLRAKVLELTKQLADPLSCAFEGPQDYIEQNAAATTSCSEIGPRNGHKEFKEQLAEELATVCNRRLEDRMLLLYETIDRLKEENYRLNDEKTLLATKVQDFDGKARQEICNLKEELAEAKVEKQELEDLLTDAVQAKHEIEMKRNEVSTQLLEVVHLKDDLLNEKQLLEEQVKMLVSPQHESEVVTNEIGVQSSGDCCSHGQEIAELRCMLREEREKNSTLMGEFDLLACQLENDVQTEIADCKNQLDWLLGELEETQQELNRTQGALADREMDIDDMQQALTASAYKCKKLEDELHKQLMFRDELEMEKQKKKLVKELEALGQEEKIPVSNGISPKDIVLHPWMRKAQMVQALGQDSIPLEKDGACLGKKEKNTVEGELCAAQMGVLLGEEMDRDGSENEPEVEMFSI